jgi:hypothetical protein
MDQGGSVVKKQKTWGINGGAKMKDDHLYDTLRKQAGLWTLRKIKEKGITPLGLPYLFKSDNIYGMGWTPAMPNTWMTVEKEWVEHGMTTEQDCALWIDHCFSKQHPVGYYGA